MPAPDGHDASFAVPLQREREAGPPLGRGRPPHEPTEERRRQVEGMAGNG